MIGKIVQIVMRTWPWSRMEKILQSHLKAKWSIFLPCVCVCVCVFKQGKLEETISPLHSEEWTHGNSIILENEIVHTFSTSTNTRLWFRGRWEKYLLYLSLLNKVDQKLNFYSPSLNSTWPWEEWDGLTYTA